MIYFKKIAEKATVNIVGALRNVLQILRFDRKRLGLSFELDRDALERGIFVVRQRLSDFPVQIGTTNQPVSLQPFLWTMKILNLYDL